MDGLRGSFTEYLKWVLVQCNSPFPICIADNWSPAHTPEAEVRTPSWSSTKFMFDELDEVLAALQSLLVPSSSKSSQSSLDKTSSKTCKSLLVKPTSKSSQSLLDKASSKSHHWIRPVPSGSTLVHCRSGSALWLPSQQLHQELSHGQAQFHCLVLLFVTVLPVFEFIISCHGFLLVTHMFLVSLIIILGI